MALAPTAKVILGTFAFAVFWILAVFPSVPFLPVGRTAGSLLGGVLMVLFRVTSPDQAYAAVDLPILGLLFGTMLVSVYLERADMFTYLSKLLSWKTKGPKDLLCRVSLVSALSSALFTNDTSCVVLTEFVLKIATRKNLPPRPFLLALASSSNIGSAATPIGNPQNLVIAFMSRITFGGFLVGILPAVLVGICVNSVVLLVMYWKSLTVEKVDEENNVVSVVVGEEEEVSSHRFSPATMSHSNRDDSDVSIPVEGLGLDSSGVERGGFGFSKKWTRASWKVSVYLVTLGMLVALLMGLDMSWSAITAALALIVLDFKDAKLSIEKVSYSLLLFFCGMFITVDGFNRTGIPSTVWELTEPYARIDRISGTVVLTVVILVLSNVASNVPTVLLLGARVAASAGEISPASERKAWLILAWVSTVAGNLSLLGSAANLIVCEQARRSQVLGYNLSFWSHLKFGVPSTLIVTAIGMLLIRG